MITIKKINNYVKWQMSGLEQMNQKSRVTGADPEFLNRGGQYDTIFRWNFVFLCACVYNHLYLSVNHVDRNLLMQKQA